MSREVLQTIFGESACLPPRSFGGIGIIAAAIPNLLVALGALGAACLASAVFGIVGLILLALCDALGYERRHAAWSALLAFGPFAGLLFYLCFMLAFIGPSAGEDW